jgi:hypothetical protein
VPWPVPLYAKPVTKPKRHHYLPESYLDGFCINGRLWLFDREELQFRLQTPKNTAVETDFYTVTDEHGSKDTSLETALAAIDGEAARILPSLNPDTPITYAEMRALAFYVALLRVRTPEFEKQHSELQLATASAAGRAFSQGASAIVFSPRSAPPTEPPSKPYLPSDLQHFLEAIRANPEALRDETRATIPSLALELGELLARMNWVFYFAARDSHFMTCDNPFIILPPEQGRPAGIATPGARKVIPLSKKVLVSIHDEGDGYAWQRMPRRAVEGVNCMCAINSDRFVISPREYPLRKVIRMTNVDRYRRGRRVDVE